MIRQVGALPFRETEDGLAILLVTSRQTGRWVIPKGNLMVGKAPHEAAEIEAEEEAGVRGLISPIAIGQFHYKKLLASGESTDAKVELFPLLVREEMTKWLEMDQRERRWFAAGHAASAVDEVALGELIHRFGEGRGPRPAG